MPPQGILDLIDGLRKTRALPNGDEVCSRCGHRGFHHAHLGQSLGGCEQCACEMFRGAVEVPRESAAEIMDGEMRVGQASHNLAAGPTESDLFAFEDEDPSE